jgi:hypothetical protein
MIQRALLLAVVLVSLLVQLPVRPTAAREPVPGDPGMRRISYQDAGESSALFSDGFESTGDMSLWSGESSLVVEEAVGYLDSFAAQATSAGLPASAETRLKRPGVDVHYRIRFKLIDLGDNELTLMRLRTVGGESLVSVGLTAARLPSIRLDATGTIFTGTTQVEPGVWHELQVGALVNRNGSRVTVWLDGEVLPELNQQVYLGSDPIGRIDLGDNTSGRTFEVLFDDVIVDTEWIEPSRQPDPLTGTLVVRTTPRLPGIAFELDGETFLTSEAGVARIEVRRWTADLRQRIQVPNSDLGSASAGAVATFWGWDSWIGARDHDVNAFFDMSYPVTIEFVDHRTEMAVDPTLVEVSSITVESSVGKSFTFTTDDLDKPQLLPGSRVVPSREGRLSEPFQYRVQEVWVRGGQVVNKGQQSFDIDIENPNHWKVELLLFDVTISAQDALFGIATGDEIELTYPDGRPERIALGSDQSETLKALPRGEYEVSVIGAGYSPARPLTLTRDDQEVELEVVTLLDISVVIGLVATTGLGLLFAGRPGILLFPIRLVRTLRTRRAISEPQL